MERINAYLVLGCNGHTEEDDFINCFGVNNPILDLTDVDESDYEKLVQFLDKACDLFDSPMYNYNKCSNTLNMLHRDLRVIKPIMLYRIQHFIRMHKACGLYVVLILKEDYNNE